MKHFLHSLIPCIIFLLCSCSNDKLEYTKLSMLEGGKTFAVPTGTAADKFVLQRFPDAKLKYFNSVLDCAIAVKDRKADAAIYDKPILQNIAAKNDGLIVLSELLVDDKYGFAVKLENNDLKAAMDGTLAEIKSNGTYDDMQKRWFPEKGNPAAMPTIEQTGANGVLKFGTAAVTEPMSFIDGDQKIVGFDVEFATYIARKLGKRIEVIDMEFGALLPALISGKVDMVGAGLSITEERAKKVLFSESYYPSGIAAAVRSTTKVVNETSTTKLKSIEDIKDKRIGVLLGSIHDAYATKNYPEAKIMEYQNVSDMLMALNTEKIDVAFFDQTALKEVLNNNKELDVLAKNIFTVPIAAGINKQNDQLRNQFNSFLKEIKSNGIYNEMVNRWMAEGVPVMPVIPKNNVNGVLKVGIVGDLGMPFTFMKEGNLAGFDIELSTRFAASIGKEFVPVDLQFGSMLASLLTNKIDLTTCSLMITEERKKQISFSDPYYESGVSVVALNKNLANYSQEKAKNVELSFLAKFSDSFYNNLIREKRYLLIFEGLKATLLISIFAALVGTILGGLVCFMRMSKRKILSAGAKIYISLLRGTPVLVLLMLIYYVVFASVNISPLLVAMFAFGLNFAAYVSEMFRTSIESIENGQQEAGIAGGFTKIQTFIFIIMPQALRQVLPVYKGEFISLVKMTSIVGYIAVQDLTKASDIIRSRTFDAFFPLLVVAVLYLLIAWLLTWALGYIEVSVDPKRKRIQTEVEVNQ
ncbi:MAG TPA: ABC transporter permease subunit [Prolixibacteraceae bacterium]